MIMMDVEGPSESRKAILDSIWAEHGGDEDWTFVTNRLHNGDLFFILSLIRFFRIHHNIATNIRFLADTPGKFAILRLYTEYIDYVAYDKRLSLLDGSDFVDWNKLRNRSNFGPGVLQRLHPQDIADGRFPIAPIVYSYGRFNLVDLFKTVLRLPLQISPVPPVISNSLREEALVSFQGYNLSHKKTVIIFPYAQTLKFDFYSTLAEFANIAISNNFIVCTAVHGDEKPIEGTIPIHISFDLMIPFCELAGNVISLRSGIGDILSSGKLKKIYLYNNTDFAQWENPNAYGMCDCSNTIVHADPSSTATKIMSDLLSPCFSSALEFVPTTLEKYLRVIGRQSHITTFDESSGCGIGRYTVFEQAALGDGWSTLEKWGVWSIGFRSVVYLKIPDIYSPPFHPTFLELDLCSPSSSVEVVVIINDRRSQFTINGLTKIAIELTSLELSAAIHRVIFDVPNPNPPAGSDRLLGIGLRRAEYTNAIHPGSVMWPRQSPTSDHFIAPAIG